MVGPPNQLGYCVVFSMLLAGTGGCASWSPENSLLSGLRTTARSQPSPDLGPAALSRSQSVELSLKTAGEMERAGHDRQAAALYDQARTLDPNAADYARRLARLYDRLNRDQDAQQEYRRAIEQAPGDADLLNDFGVFHLRRERWSAAEPWFRKSLDARPDHERAAVNLALCVGMQGRITESYQTFAGIVGAAAAHCNVGVLLARQGRTVEAREHFEQALALDASLRPARELLAQLDRS